MLVVHHLAQVQADLEDAKAMMVARLQSLASRLPPDDPDREILASCIRDLVGSLRVARAAAAPTGPRGAVDFHRSIQ